MSSTSDVAVAGSAGPPALPPGARGTLAVSARYLRDPFGTLLEAGRRFGDPFTFPTFLGPVVITGDPAGIKELLTADPGLYTALGADLLGPVLGASNLILLSGDAHRAMRRFYNPQFHGERVQAYGSACSSRRGRRTAARMACGRSSSRWSR